ncbi:MAG: hypothetical protein IKP95_01470 [Ruminococcus sp.]|nr:hypothetical protein [Ruminococcus sp.]
MLDGIGIIKASAGLPVRDTVTKLLGSRFSRPVIYGWHVDPTVSDPAQAVTYLADAAGMTPAAMGASAFSYGSWEDAFFMPKPCMLKSDGTVAYYLDPNDYTKKADGTPSDVANSSFDGNAMMEWPLIWYKFLPGEAEGEGYFYCSDQQADRDFKCWCNINAADQITPHFYTAIYNASGINKLRSLSGISLTEANGAAKVSASALVSRAAVNDTGQTPEWSISQLCDRLLINALLVLLGKSLNTQQTYGFGYTSVSSVSSISTGSMNTKGLFWGSTSSQTDGVKVFGMENWWGAQYDINLGIIFANDRMLVKLTSGTADGSYTDSYNFTGRGYIDVGPVPDNSSRIDTMSFSGYGMYPKGICQYDQDPSTVAKHYCGYLIRASLQMPLELGNYYCTPDNFLAKGAVTIPSDRARTENQCLHLNGSYEVISHKTGIQVTNYICKEQNGDLYVLAAHLGWHNSPWSYRSSEYTAETGSLRFAVVARDPQNDDLYTPADAGSYVTFKQNDPRLFAFGGTVYSGAKSGAFTAISLSSDLQDSANSTRLSCKPIS